ncbi:MAG TPA: hypothetical protein VFG42_21895 [Baekduia sp.]|uniref:hypothetical protein n=1 Tax=Baekduia sp. TaxID=2600305 RepID=UPI002D78734A|nr:hypothetical protein [Baekduia sp.]HET6509466.1 hypothetical protein [Baekduia sp.]
MANLSIRRRKSKKQRAVSAVGNAGSAAWTFLKARFAWLMGKKAARVAVPAAAAGTVAVVAKKRFSHDDPSSRTSAPTAPNGVPTAPAGVA